jgi:WD40 repeat protein
MSDQHFDNKQPNQGAQGTFNAPVNTGPQVNQQWQTVHGNQTNIAGGEHHHHYGEPPLQFARPIPPAPPEDFVARPHEFNQLLAHLCSSDSGPVAITAALAGAGGFGKTTLAKAICHDEQVQAAFDGVLWVEVGQEPGNLIGKVEDLVLHLTGARQRAGFTDLNAAATRLAQALGERRLLLVIDDVWDSAHLQPFLEGGPHCTRLVTTRLPHVLPTAARAVPVDAMQQDEAVALLGFGLPDAAAHTATLQALAHRLGEWALLLKLVNGALREQVDAGSPLSEAFAFVNEGLDEEGISAFNLEHQEGRHAAVDRTIALSLRLLSSEEQARYAELAIFPEDVDVPLATVTRYWQATGTLSDFKAKNLCGKLARLSLLLRYDLAAKIIRLHDVVRSYLQHTHAANLPTWHTALLDAHRPTDGWPTLPADEPYLWRHLAEHLRDASRSEELAALLTDFGWLQAKLEATDINALLADYDELEPLPEPHTLVRDALRLSSHVLAEDTTQLVEQLHGRMCSLDTPSIPTLLAQAASSKTAPWLRPLYPCFILPGNPLIRTFIGHNSDVSDVAECIGGSYVLSSSMDKTLKLWDITTGTCVHTFIGHNGQVLSMAIFPNSQKALSASRDKTVKLWDINTGRCLYTFQEHQARVLDVKLLPDNRRFISGSRDHTLKLWDIATGKCLHTFTGHDGSVTSVAVLTNRKQVLSGSADHTLKLWDIATGKCLRTFTGHDRSVTSVAVLANRKQVLSGSADHTLKLWDIATGKCMYTFRGHSNPVWSILILTNEQYAVSASKDQTLKLWKIDIDRTHPSQTHHHKGVTGLAVLNSCQCILSSSMDSTLKLWDMRTGEHLRTFEGHKDRVTSVLTLSDDQHALSTSQDKTIKLWDITTGRCLRTFEGHTASVDKVAISEDELYIISASGDQTLKLWDVQTGICRYTFIGHRNWVMDVVILPGEKHALSASWDKTLRLWDIATGTCIHTFQGHRKGIRSIAILSDGQYAISASADGTLRVWDINACNYSSTWMQGHRGEIWCVVSLTNGQYAISASRDETLILWNTKTAKALTHFRGESPFYCCAVTDDCQIVVAGDQSGVVYFLRLEGLE